MPDITSALRLAVATLMNRLAPPNNNERSTIGHRLHARPTRKMNGNRAVSTDQIEELLNAFAVPNWKAMCKPENEGALDQ